MEHSQPVHSNDFDAALQRALAGSRYVQRLLAHADELLPWLRANYATPCTLAEMQAWLNAMPGANEAELAHALRQLRKRVMLKLVTRDLGGLADLDEVMSSMSALAELCLQRAQACVMAELSVQYGTPRGAASGTAQELLVIGMGKLGGGELNVSSDVDLIFLYPEDGACDGARTLSNHEFFSKLGRRLIALINEITETGYVFRVDMRLRPYGDSGPLAMSFAALEEYLVEQGREWERYAWIKARVVAPQDCAAGDELMRLVLPFVFRKYLDFGAFDSMRKLHAQIRQEVLRRDRAGNIKLGPGGIREIEFIAQVFQLIRGGRDASLRIRPTQQVLRRLRENGQLDVDTVADLSAAYIFLRNLEHRLQYLDDQQTQDLPQNPDDQARVAAAMNYADYAALLEQLQQHRTRVSAQFELIFSTQENASPATDVTVWYEGMEAQAVADALANLGYAASAELAARLMQMRNSARLRQLPESSRQRLDKLIPQFVTLCAARPQQERAVTLLRVFDLLESISRRASYLAFLAEYPQVLHRLTAIAGASVWACTYLIQHPILLDELLDAREIYRAPQWPELEQALQTQLDEPGADRERQMDVLRQFQHSQTFHLLAMDLQGLLPLERLSDHLSDLADLILRQVLRLCWHDARKKHREHARFACISYGKLGGRELGYASDLDLIFLYDDSHPDAAETYAKLAQHINTMLGSYTSAGRLYEVDLRLRPNGASGLLVSSMPAFALYQQQHAWMWEHQALTRARFSAGDAQVGEKFEVLRVQVLHQPRDLEALRREIVSMRQKMRDGHPNPSTLFDLKHDMGGMVDIEFMVQFLVLAYADMHPELAVNSGNLALLAGAATLGLVDTQLAAAVSHTYRSLRDMQHKMRLNNQVPCRIHADEIDTAPVLALWNVLLGEAGIV